MSRVAPRPNLAPTLPSCPVAALRAELSSLLDHPAIASERRYVAEPLLRQCLDVARLLRWQQLVVQECAAWEEKQLAAEEAQIRRSVGQYYNSDCY